MEDGVAHKAGRPITLIAGEGPAELDPVYLWTENDRARWENGRNANDMDFDTMLREQSVLVEKAKSKTWRPWSVFVQFLLIGIFLASLLVIIPFLLWKSIIGPTGSAFWEWAVEKRNQLR